MYESHRSLRDDFEVSSAELDTLVRHRARNRRGRRHLRRAPDRGRIRRLHRHAGANGGRRPRGRDARPRLPPADRAHGQPFVSHPGARRAPRRSPDGDFGAGPAGRNVRLRSRVAPPPPVQPAHRAVAAGLAAPDPPPLAGPDRERAGRPAPGPRSDLLPLPGQPAGRAEVNPRYEGDVRLRQRLFRAFTRGASGGRRGDRSSSRPGSRRGRRRSTAEGRTDSGMCRVICFTPPPRSDAGRDGRRRGRRGRRRLGGRDGGARRDLPLGAGVREQGRGDGLLEPAPPRSNLGVEPLPTEPAAEDLHQRAYFEAHRSPLLCDYARRERALSAASSVRTTISWPWCLSGRPGPSRRSCCRAGRSPGCPTLRRREARARRAAGDAARCLRSPVRGVLPVFDGLARRALRRRPADHWQLHAHVYPPLLRSATVRSSWSATRCWRSRSGI